MTVIDSVLDWLQSLIYGFSDFSAWMTSELVIGWFKVTPLSLFGMSSLLVILGFFIIKLVNIFS